MQTTLTSKAQITLPKGIRMLLQVEPGDKLDFVPQPDGRITVSKVSKASQASFASLRGLLPRPQRACSVEEMNQAVMEMVAQRHTESSAKSLPRLPKSGQKHARA